ncbi:GNAT family N-acetyltransferase [Rufibacter latericius]|uniref:GNAT family N-acetyltransferase n=1 Tax=Rufibacter latericius TaxID=2487040 RepID=A0A3M9MCR5_9BACT|nr:GNAT family N-acetyltransferase [Rufibacter latericius]RNI23360.1 GNAT family N-acetyltransferase [Rufibacter latericius]
MIQLLRHHEIDPVSWEACLQKADAPLVYLHAWYLEVVCRGHWEALVEIQDNEYVSLFPLPVRTLLGRKKVYQPLFTQQLGLVVTPASQHRTPEEYLALLPVHYSAVQYQMPWCHERTLILPTPWAYRTRPNYELSLSPAYAEVRQNYSSNLRRNLKKAEKEKLTVVPTSGIKSLVELFRNTKGKELPELRNRHYQTLEGLYGRVKQEKAGQVWEVRLRGELLAAAFLLETDHAITFLFGASSPKGRQKSAMAFLLDHIIAQAAGSGKTFDFEGSEVPGVANFYASFGAQPVWYVSLSSKPKSTALQWSPTVFSFLAKHLR